MADIKTLIRTQAGYESWDGGTVPGSVLQAAVGSQTTLNVTGYDVTVSGACDLPPTAVLTVAGGTFTGDAVSKTTLGRFAYASDGTIENCVFGNFYGQPAHSGAILVQGYVAPIVGFTLRDCVVNGGHDAEWFGIDAIADGPYQQPVCTVTAIGSDYVDYTVAWNPHSVVLTAGRYAYFVESGQYHRISNTGANRVYLDTTRFSLAGLSEGDVFTVTLGAMVDCTFDGNHFNIGRGSSTGGWYGEPANTAVLSLFGLAFGTAITDNTFEIVNAYEYYDGGGRITAISDTSLIFSGYITAGPTHHLNPYEWDAYYPNSHTTITGNTFIGFNSAMGDVTALSAAYYNPTWATTFQTEDENLELMNWDSWARASFTKGDGSRDATGGFPALKHGTTIGGNVWPAGCGALVWDCADARVYGNSTSVSTNYVLDPYGYYTLDAPDNPRNGALLDPYRNGDATATTFALAANAEDAHIDLAWTAKTGPYLIERRVV